MPDNQHPPFEHNAQVHPRRLNRWLDKNAQGGKLRRCETYITLPAFTKADEWNGYSDIVVAFNFEADNNFSLKVPITAPDSPDYALFISWHEDGVMHRHLLWDATGSNLNFTTVPYTGQLIKKNFRLEVWNTSQGAVSNGADVLFYTSKLQSIDYRYGSDTALVDDGGEVNNFADITTNPANSYASLLVTGITLVTSLNTTYYLAPNINGRASYITTDSTKKFSWSGTQWILEYSGPLWHTAFYSNDNVTNPFDVTTWVAFDGLVGGSPSIFASASYSFSYGLPLTFPSDSVSTTN